MEGINPKTLNDKIRLKKCLKLRKYAPDISDEKIKEIYSFLKNTKYKVILTAEMLYFINDKDKIIKASVVASQIGQQYERIELSTYAYTMIKSRTNYSSGGGCSSCGGCSSNNNNNNNNNNA